MSDRRKEAALQAPPDELHPQERKSMFTTIAILMVGCLVVNAVVLSLAYFTDGARVGSVLAQTSSTLEPRVGRHGHR